MWNRKKPIKKTIPNDHPKFERRPSHIKQEELAKAEEREWEEEVKEVFNDVNSRRIESSLD